MIYKTNPKVLDTGGDGYSDYDEIDSGTNPLNSKNNPGSNIKRTLISVFTSIVVALILYYIVPYLFANINRNKESDWVEEGINKRNKKSSELIESNLNNYESKIPSEITSED